MNEDTAEGKLVQLVGRIQAKWGRLTPDDAALVSGSRKQLTGKLHWLYGISKEEAEVALSELEKGGV